MNECVVCMEGGELNERAGNVITEKESKWPSLRPALHPLRQTEMISVFAAFVNQTSIVRSQ